MFGVAASGSVQEESGCGPWGQVWGEDCMILKVSSNPEDSVILRFFPDYLKHFSHSLTVYHIFCSVFYSVMVFFTVFMKVDLKG